MDWFTVDKVGLRKLIEKRGKAFAVFELIQNAWDTDAKHIKVDVVAIPNRPLATITVEDDDPDGFRTLTHAFTLFAESEKKSDPTKRGRFNLGEKLVLALCESATISSTTGQIVFDETGRHERRRKRTAGSVFEGQMRFTRAELEEVDRAVRTLILPLTCETVYNGSLLPAREPLRQFEATLPTEISDDSGYLRRTQRRTIVSVHEVRDGETPTLYELGIPVVELGGGERWHVNVHQKIPLNADRDNVTPSYLQTIRVQLANEMLDYIAKPDATQVWIDAALADERIEKDAVSKIVDERFGKKRAIYDPSDVEANKQLMNEGYTIIAGGTFSQTQWENVRQAGVLAAGTIRPSGRRYGPGGEPERVILPERYTHGQREVVQFAKDLALRLLGKAIQVQIVSEITEQHGAWYGNECLTFNVGRLGKVWFDRRRTLSAVLELLWHEFAHDRIHDHLTRGFADEVARLAAKTILVALTEPSFLHSICGRPEQEVEETDAIASQVDALL